MNNNLFSVIFVTLGITGLTACGNVDRSALQPSTAIAGGASASATASATGSLYITSLEPKPGGSIAIYSGNPLKFSRAITNGVDYPGFLAFNMREQLFVANESGQNVTIYKNSGGSLVRTLSNKWMKTPQREAISSKNDLYVVSRNFVNIFVNSRQKQTKKIHLNAASAVAIDSSDNAYIPATTNSIDVFLPRATTPSRTITQGVNGVLDLAIDASGDLFVANQQPLPCGNITVYDAATGTLEKTITDGVCNSGGFAFDLLGNVYVINVGTEKSIPASVTIYSAGTDELTETITNGISNPDSLAVDPSRNLYVATRNIPGKVTEYKVNQTSPSRVLTKGIYFPLDLEWRR